MTSLMRVCNSAPSPTATTLPCHYAWFTARVACMQAPPRSTTSSGMLGEGCPHCKPARQVYNPAVGQDKRAWSARGRSASMNPWLFVAVYAGARLLEAGVRGESVITTVAGGAVGDGRPATDAWLYNPNGMSAWYNTSSGGVVLYIADGSNHRIRRVNEGGVISSV
ncbi:hypothetical protein EON66_05270, partial [archaeon]